MMCPKCKSNNYGVCCPGGYWSVTFKGDPDAIEFPAKCYVCGYEDIVYMSGEAFPHYNYAAPAFYGGYKL